MKLIQIWRVLIFSNVMIALAAASQSLLTYQVLGLSVNWYVVILEFCSTLLLYNFSLYLSMPGEQSDSPFIRTKWFQKNKGAIAVFSFFALLVLLYCLYSLHIYTYFLLGAVGLLSLGYALPILRIKGKTVTFRQIAGLKVFLIAFVWALSSVGLPVTESIDTPSEVLPTPLIMYWFCLEFLFVLAITLPFDIRDVKQDQYYHLKTIPTMLGVEKTKALCYFILLIHFLILLLANVDLSVKSGLVLVDIMVLSIFYFFIFKNKNANYEQVYLLDALLIIQYLVVYFTVYFQ